MMFKFHTGKFGLSGVGWFRHWRIPSLYAKVKDFSGPVARTGVRKVTTDR